LIMPGCPANSVAEMDHTQIQSATASFARPCSVLGKQEPDHAQTALRVHVTL
jgi:hypothetical protein